MPHLSGALPIQATDTCIAVRNATADGVETRLLVTDEFIARPGDLVCTRRLATPNQVVVVCSVLLEVFASVITRRDHSLVRVYTNAAVAPDRIVVAVGEHRQPP